MDDGPDQTQLLVDRPCVGGLERSGGLYGQPANWTADRNESTIRSEIWEEPWA